MEVQILVNQQNIETHAAVIEQLQAAVKERDEQVTGLSKMVAQLNSEVRAMRQAPHVA